MNIPNKILNIFPVLLFLLIYVSAGFAQSNNDGIEKVYEKFTQAYESLDLSLIESLYAEESYYLTPNPEEGVRIGRDKIMESFQGTFENAEERGSSLKMSFNILKREQSENLAYDVGYYKFEAFPKKGEPFKAAGKFVTVLRKNSQGEWQFVVDAFSDAPINLFEETK